MQIITVKIDEKHHIRVRILEPEIKVEIVKTGNNIPIDLDKEPVILFRGRDKLALPMLEFYRSLCVEDGATEYQLQSMDTMIRKFIEFKLNNPDTMKQPGSTRGK